MAQHIHLRKLWKVLEIVAAKLRRQRAGGALALFERGQGVPASPRRAALEQYRLVEPGTPRGQRPSHAASASARRSTSAAEWTSVAQTSSASSRSENQSPRRTPANTPRSSARW